MRQHAFEELAALNRIRLERNLSFRELGAQIGLPERTVFRLLSADSPRLYDRTLFRIRRYLNSQLEAVSSTGPGITTGGVR